MKTWNCVQCGKKCKKMFTLFCSEACAQAYHAKVREAGSRG